MRFQHIDLSKWMSIGTVNRSRGASLKESTLIVLSEDDWKSGKVFQRVSSPLRERVHLARTRLNDPLKAGGLLALPVRAQEEAEVWVGLLPATRTMFSLLEFARDTLKGAVHPTHSTLRIVLLSELALLEDADQVAEAFGAATAARVFLMPTFGKRAKERKSWKLSRVDWISANFDELESYCYGYATAEGGNLARFLTTLPPNMLDPAAYGRRIREISRGNRVGVRFYSKTQLKRMGAGAFTAVDQGNPGSAGGIYELTYTPRKVKARGTVHLAGKGMCFDTGGYDVKVGGGMITMKGDMQGSAVALATLITAARLELPYRMKAFLAVTENHLSPKAYKADDVVTALNGTTIEVVNTDAEGRMVLADTLTLASRGKPDCVIDFATLTGSAVRAIGTKYSAGFTNREKLHEPIREAGRISGERLWTFPLDAADPKALDSKVADTLQCVKGSGPDHILASCFLSKFVEPNVPWVHVDLAASENEGGIGHVDSLFTGFGVRWALEFIRRG